MNSTLTDRQLTLGRSVLKNLKGRDLEEIWRERMDEITAVAMVALVVAYATYVFVL